MNGWMYCLLVQCTMHHACVCCEHVPCVVLVADDGLHHAPHIMLVVVLHGPGLRKFKFSYCFILFHSVLYKTQEPIILISNVSISHEASASGIEIHPNMSRPLVQPLQSCLHQPPVCTLDSIALHIIMCCHLLLIATHTQFASLCHCMPCPICRYSPSFPIPHPPLSSPPLPCSREVAVKV